MPLNFPDSPALNDTFTVNSKTWVWDGVGWSLSQSEGDFVIDGDLTVDHINSEFDGPVVMSIKNTSPGQIAKGMPVYATGSVGASGAVEVAASRADTASTMPALGLTQQTLAVNEEGHAAVIGVIRQMDTSTYAINDELYVAPTGGLTTTRPTGSTELVQKIGRVVRSHSSTGEILVLGAGRSNDVPNNVVAGGLTIDTDTLHVDSTNNRVGIGTTSPTKSLHVYSATIDQVARFESGDTRGGIEFADSGTTNSVKIAAVGNDFRVRTGSVDVLNVTDGGRVGVGIDAPDAKFHVHGGASDTNIRVTSSDAGAYIGFDDSTTTGDWFRQRIGVSGNDLRFVTNNNSSRMVILSNGNVGINDATPSYRLDVNGTGRFTGNLTSNGSVHSEGPDGGGVMRYWQANHEYVMWGTNNMTSQEYCMISNGTTTYLSGGAGGSVYIRGGNNDTSPELQVSTSAVTISGNTVYHAGNVNKDGVNWTCEVLRCNEANADNGSASDPSFTFASDTNTGIYRYGSDAIGFATGGGYRGYWNSNGIYLASGDWFRTTGQAGWYNETYSGGMYQTDSNYVKVYNAKGIETNKVGSANYNTAGVYINSSSPHLAFHPGGQAPQLRVGYNNNTIYFRNWPDTGWCTIEAVVINHSSRVDKQDITDFANTPSSLSSDSNSEFGRSGTDLVRQLRPRHYRWDWDKNMRQLPLSPRRTRALERLNELRESRGLEEFISDESWHVCGRDCDGSETDPCWWVKDWNAGYFGFIAEEVGDVAPEAGRLDSQTGKLSGLDPLAMSAIIVASLQEVLDRLDILEGTSGDGRTS